MPYANIGDLPEEVRSRYSPACQKVWLDSYNRAARSDTTGGAQDEAAAEKVAHTAAGMCAGKASKAEADQFTADMNSLVGAVMGPEGYGTGRTSKAEPLDPDQTEAWFAGKIPRRLLAIPFGGPIPSADGKGRDMDAEFFDERTDIKPDWFAERPVDWHHSQDPSGRMNGVLIGKAKNLSMDEDGWWVDLWLNAGERRLEMVRKLAEKGAQLFGSSYAYPNLVRRGKAGHIDVWPYMMQTLSTSPQNTMSILRPAKAVMDAFTEADITVDARLRDVLTELATLRDLDANLTGEAAAKAGRELSGANMQELDEWLEMLEGIAKRAKSLRDRVRTKYEKDDVSSAPKHE